MIVVTAIDTITFIVITIIAATTTIVRNLIDTTVNVIVPTLIDVIISNTSCMPTDVIIVFVDVAAIDATAITIVIFLSRITMLINFTFDPVSITVVRRSCGLLPYNPTKSN